MGEQKLISKDDSALREKLIVLLPSLAGGGAERVAALLLPEFSRSFDVTLALLENHQVYKVPPHIETVCFSPKLTGNMAHVIRIPLHLAALIRLVRRNRAKVVLSFMEQANILNIAASMLTGHKAIISQRIVPSKQYEDKGNLGRCILWISRRLYPRAAHILAVSEQIRKNLITEYDIPAHRVTFIPNPVDLKGLAGEIQCSRATNSLPRPYLLHVGRLKLSQKGQDILLKAFSKISDHWPDLSLVLVGEGPDRPEIERIVKEHGLDSRVLLTGWERNIAGIMVDAEAFVLPSRYEGWPNVLVEAMACGCPVIAADCESGPREILGDSEYGLLIAPSNPATLARALSEILQTPVFRRSLIQLAKLQAEAFSTEKMATRYLKAIFSSLPPEPGARFARSAQGDSLNRNSMVKLRP